MNRTQKILIAVGIGVGLAFLYRRYMMPKKQTQTGGTPKDDSVLISTNEDEPQNRAEMEEFVIENIEATDEETMMGMDGVQFVWNPKLGKFYPQGTLTEGQEPAYYESIFYSADGNLEADIPNSVEVAQNTVSNLTDEELKMLYQITKTIKENPSTKGDIDLVIQRMNITNPRLKQEIKTRLLKRMNDIKIAKKDRGWRKKWSQFLKRRKKRRNNFKEATGLNLVKYRQAVAKVCGAMKPNARYSKDFLVKHKACSDMVLEKMRKRASRKLQSEVSNEPVGIKNIINEQRQNQFSNQIVNRQGTGQFAGMREDGRSNNYTETLVSEGLV